MADRKFKFNNMSTYVRNVIEPIISALRHVHRADVDALRANTTATANALRADLTDLQNQFNAQIAALKAYIASMAVINVGWIGIWPYGTNPPDYKQVNGLWTWILCNGQTVTPGYTQLYAMLDTDKKVPNYQGLFLRGAGGNAAAIGTIQEDMIRKPTNTTGGTVTWLSMRDAHRGCGAMTTGDGITASYCTHWKDGSDSQDGIWRITLNLATVINSLWSATYYGAETRPRNTAVRYWIRALPTNGTATL